MPVQRGAAVADAFGRDGGVEIVPDLLGEFRLVAVFGDDSGVEAHALKGPVEYLGPDALGQGAAAELADPAGETDISGRGDSGGGGHGHGTGLRAQRFAYRGLLRQRGGAEKTQQD